MEKLPVDSNCSAAQDEAEYSGVGGFLLLFVILVFIGSFNLVYSSIPVLYRGFEYFNGFSLLVFLIAIPIFLTGVYGFYVFYLLVNKDPKAPGHAQRWIIVTFIFNLVIGLLVILTTNDIPITFFSSSIFAVIWLAYLANSRRVKATYSANDPKRIEEIFDEGMRLYELGYEKDAFMHFHEAANLGDSDAQYNLGVMYLNGEGTKSDLEMARYWLQKSSDSGNEDARIILNDELPATGLST